MALEAASLYAKLGLDSSGFQRGMKGAKGELTGFGSTLSQAGSMIMRFAGPLALGLGAAQLVRFAKGAVDASSQARATGLAFRNLSGDVGLAARNMAAMEKATRGLASETEMQAIANQLLGMQIVDTSDELEEVVEVSRRLGDAFRNMGAADAANEFAIMISNMSVQRLDSFGISSGKVRERIEELMKANQDMTREQAFFQATMEQARATLARLGPEADTAKTAGQELNAALGDLSVTVGDRLSPAVGTATRGLVDFVKGLDSALQASGDLGGWLLRNTSTFDAYQNAMAAANMGHLAVSESVWNYMQREVEADHELRKLGITTESVTEEQLGLARAHTEAARAAREMGAAHRFAATDMELMAGGGAALAYGLGQVGAVGGGLEQQARSMFDEHNQAILDARETATRELQTSMSQATSQLRNVISSAMTPTLGEVWKPEEGGDRMDENARRLATVAVGGFSSEWLNQLNTQFAGMSFWQPIADAMASGDEGALKQAASDLLSGPNVAQLWDKDLIKQKVKDELTAQNMREELINTIMSELSAEGIQVGAGDISMAMGPMAGVGRTLIGGLDDGLTGAIQGMEVGPKMIDTIGAQLEGQEERFKILAEAIAGGLNTALPAAIGEINLIEMLTQAVAERIGAGGTVGAAGGEASYQGGGIVPGPMGAPQRAVVHGGEMIIDPMRGGGLMVDIPVVVEMDGEAIARALGRRVARQRGGMVRL